MTLWDDLPSAAKNSGGLDPLRSVLESTTTSGPTEQTDSDGTWSVYTATLNLTGPLALDPRTGAFSGGSGTGGTPIEFRDRTLSGELALHLTGPGGSRDGGWRFILGAPSVAIRTPFLRGAFLDAQGQLRADPARPTVAFVLPALRIRLLQPAGAALGVKLLSATTSGSPTDNIYEFIRMEPPHALIGPGDAIGFAYRTAVLDLSGTEGPSGVPPTARVQPDEWQGLFLPEVRLFVAPTGVEGLAVSAGARDLWIGIGVHEGVTGVFDAEIVNRGQTPAISVRFATPAGEHIADPGTGTAQLPEHCTLFVDTAGGLAPIRITIVADGVTTEDDRAEIETPATGTISITVTAEDAAAHSTTRTFTATRRVPSGPAVPPADSSVTVTPLQQDTHVIVREAVTPTHVTVRLEPRAGVTWTWPDGGPITGEVAEVPVGAGGPVVVTATFPAPERITANCYFLFDHPKKSEGDAYAANEKNTRIGPAAEPDAHGGSTTFTESMRDRRTTIGAGTKLTVDGYASFEGDDTSAQQERNLKLSERRRDMAVGILTGLGYTNVHAGEAHGHADADAGTAIVAGGPTPPEGSSGWWLARVYSEVPAAAEVCTAELRRRAVDPPAQLDPKPPARERPDCFRKIGARVELVRSTLIRAEIYGKFDIETAAEAALAGNGQPPLRTGPRNPNDGICVFLVRLRLSEDRGAWEVTGEFRALDADLDGLAKLDEATADPTTLNVLGALSVLAPLTSSAANLSPAAGGLVALGSVTVGASALLHTHSLILRGAELKVTDGIVGPDGTTTAADSGTQVSVLLDLEVAFSFDLTLIRVDPAKPVTTRYKAIGVRSQWGTEGAPGAPEYVPLPVFDPSRGYTLDVPTGALSARPPLDELLRVLGFRVSRDNPTFLEVEVGLGVDLGIVGVDAVRIRARLDGPPFDVQLTKLVATLDVPGVLHGAGSLEFTDLGFKGAFDLTVVPVNIRVSAVLAVERDQGVTGVLIGGEVQFPVPILLGNSGLGIYGFLGGIGVNYARDETNTGSVPALGWLQQQLARPGGVMDPTGWTLTPGAYAFAAGLLVGTVDAGFTLHLKGIVLIEVPGPRLLLVMKADVLSLPPALKSEQSATFLAVLDIDFGRGTITIGVVAEYSIARILRIRVPVAAFFNANSPEDWFVYLGEYADRVTVDVLDVISGSGYLMVRGNGVNLPTDPPLVVPNGLAVAVGFHLQAVLMGSKSVGLYLEVAAGFDAVLGLDPLYLGGIISVKGELRLWIVSVSASAKLTVEVATVGGVQQPYVHGEVCGSVEFFFFEVKGCLELTIGSKPTATADPKDLVAGVSLISRLPALLEGTGASAPVDGKLADALKEGDPAVLPTVPLDAIPVISFAVAPTGGGDIVMGKTAFGNSGAPANPWVRIGDRWWRYELVGVHLDGPLTPSAGKTPSTWWKPPANGGPTAGPSLALLDWLPTPHPRAVPYGEALTTQVTDRWGTVCGTASPETPVLWTFDGCPIGPSPAGWTLTGVPWPDEDGFFRSSPPATRIDVREPWRIDPLTDLLQGTAPARVIGDAVPCYNGKPGSAESPLEQWSDHQPRTFSGGTLPSDDFSTVTEYLADGADLSDLPAVHQESAWDPSLRTRRGENHDCEGRILKSPQLDEPEPAPFGTELDQQRVLEAWNASEFKPDALANAVTLHSAGDGLLEFAVLLLVPEHAFSGALLLSLRRHDGGEVRKIPVSTDHFVDSDNPLPERWVTDGKPWADPVQRAGRIAARVVATSRERLFPVLVREKGGPGVTRIVIGWDRRRARDLDFPAVYLVAAEALRQSERSRFDWDNTTIDTDRQALSNALTQPEDDHALLVPGAEYTVRVEWKASSETGEAQPAATKPADWSTIDSVTQSFRFQADPAFEAPKDLSPWILATTPGMDDVGVFRREKVRIAFATQKVAALFDAYGQELRLLVRAASGAHPEPPTGGGPTAPFLIPVTAAAPFGHLSSTFGVTPPWHQAVLEMLDATGQTCVPISGTATQTYTLTLEYDFEPLTDYLIDIHAVPKGAPASATGLVHRVGFTTSRFLNAADLASFIAPATVEHRVVPAPAALAALPDAPTGAQVDEAFQAAGLAVPQVPDFPRVQLLWTADDIPQPFAVVLESSEPLWRSRVVPTIVQAPPDAPDPTHQYWAARPADWLSVVPSTAPAAPGDPPRAGIQRIVKGPGGTRAIALLAPGSRGREARLDLRTAADQLAGTAAASVTATRVSLLRAPWEVED